MRQRTNYLTNDAAKDDIIRPDLREQFGIYNAVNFPVLTRQGELLGCFELHNKQDGRPFSSVDLAYLQGLAASAAVALENARLLERIRQADRRKDEFLAMLAHELRNPLAPMRNALELLRLRGSDPDVSISSRQVMDRQLRHMARLIDDLLDVSRITRGRIELRCEQLDLAQLVRQCVEGHRPAADAASLSLNVDVPQIPVWVRGDETRLSQIMDNLLTNAIKFSEAGGRLEIHLLHDRYRNDAVITVRDSGIGIAPEDLQHVFDIFSQVDRSLDRKRGGLGLGLALVKGLAELHGGSASADSPGIGAGSTFTVHVPTLPEPAALVNSLPRVRPPASALQVLVIEDNRDAATTLCMLLRAFGYDAAVAHSGPDGIDKARRLQPQVVLCDIGLPGMDGFAVARALRHDPAFAKTRLIAVTGYGREEDKSRALEAGFDEHITKPADAEQLLAKLAVINQTPL
jgi:signal transduction histidine kinase